MMVSREIEWMSKNRIQNDYKTMDCNNNNNYNINSMVRDSLMMLWCIKRYVQLYCYNNQIQNRATETKTITVQQGRKQESKTTTNRKERKIYFFLFLMLVTIKKIKIFCTSFVWKKETVWFCYYVVVLCLLYACSFMASKESRVKQKGELLKNIVRYYSGRELWPN